MNRENTVEKSAASADSSAITDESELLTQVVETIHRWKGDRTNPVYRRLVGIRTVSAPTARPYQSPMDQDIELGLVPPLIKRGV